MMKTDACETIMQTDNDTAAIETPKFAPNEVHLEVLRRIRSLSGAQAGDNKDALLEMVLELKHEGFVEWHGGLMIGEWRLTPLGHATLVEHNPNEVPLLAVAPELADLYREVRASGQVYGEAIIAGADETHARSRNERALHRYIGALEELLIQARGGSLS